MRNKIFILTILFVFFMGFASAFLVSDQGTDVKEVSTGNITALANLTISMYDHPTAGTLIFQQTFEGGIVNGSWNVMINPNLEYGRSYWKDYEINGEDLDFDGNERLEFQSSVGPINNLTFVNLSLINSCPSGSSIRLIYSNGSVLCETDDSGSGSQDLTNYALKNQSETFQGNITTSQTGFFGWLGSLFSRINKLFVQDIEFNGTINGSGNIITNQNVTATYFIGNGSYLTGISQDSYNDGWINNTIDNRILTNNNSVNSYISSNNNSLNNYILWVNSTNAGGGTPSEVDPYWTGNITLFNSSWLSTYNSTVNTSINNYISSNNLSLQNYILWVNSTNPTGAGSYNDAWINQTIYNRTDVNINISTANTSMFNYVNLQNTSQTNYINSNNQSIQNYILYVNSTNLAGSGEPLWNANYSTFLTHATTSYVDSQNTSMRNYIGTVNTSMFNYLNYNNISVTNAINSIASIGEPNWNANYSIFLTHMPYSAWNATNTSYMTGDNFTLQNTSLRNYILYVNSTNPTGAGSYNDAWINQTIYNRTDVNINISTANTSMFNYVNLQNTSQTNYINSNNQSIQNYILYVNSTNPAGSGEPLWNANYSTFLTHATTSYVDSQNTSQTNYINSNNQSIQNYILYVNSTNPAGSGEPLWNANYSTFLTHATTSYVDSQNTSMRNYIGTVNTSMFNYLNYNNISVTNAINSIASIGEPNWNANYSTFLTHITWAQAMNGTLATTLYVDNQNTSNNNYLVSYVSLNNQSLNNYITSYVTSNNASLNNYVNYNNISVTNAINSIASIGEPNWNANYSTFLTHITWAQVMNGTLLQSSQWNATNTSYMTGDNFTLQNNSLRNYILWVNSTNGVGSGTYNDAWINQTIYNRTQVDILAATSDLHTHNASNITSPIWVNKTGDTMSGELNMDSNNITAVDCITFASGGKICSG